MKKTLLIITLLAVALMAGYRYLERSPFIYKRITGHAVDDFSQSVASKSQIKMAAAFKNYLTNNSKVTLTVSFASPAQNQPSATESQEFTKSNFFTFIDNILYSLEDCSVSTQLQEFTLAPDRKSANFTFTATGEGNENLSYGEVHSKVKFNAESTCSGHVLFGDHKKPMFNTMDCKVKVTSMPKLG